MVTLTPQPGLTAHKEEALRQKLEDYKAKLTEEEIKKNNLNHKEIVKSAILHDVGKINTPLNVIDKSILVLLNNITKTKIKKYSDRNSKIYIFYNHGEEGYKILKEKGYDI